MITIPSNALAAVAKWASIDDVRPQLHMVLFTAREYVACDGHRLVRVPLEYTGKPFGVDRRHLLAAIAAQRELRSGDSITIEPSNGRVELGIASGSGAAAMAMTVPIRDASQFPAYEQVMPKERPATSPDGYAFDPRYLAAIDEVIKAIEEPSMRGVRVTAWSHDAFGPMAFETEGGVRFVIMPMRM